MFVRLRYGVEVEYHVVVFSSGLIIVKEVLHIAKQKYKRSKLTLVNEHGIKLKLDEFVDNAMCYTVKRVQNI